MHEPRGMYTSLGVTRVPCFRTWRTGDEHHHCNRDRWHLENVHECICGKYAKERRRQVRMVRE